MRDYCQKGRVMIRLLSHAEQLAAYLREELLRGRWQEHMPGVARLEAELGVNHTTVGQALGLLEDEGFLVSTGDRRRRQIVLPGKAASPAMRIAFLTYEPAANDESYVIQILHGLADQGHRAFFANKTLVELGMDVPRVSRMVKQTKADAWIVGAASREVLEWFVGNGLRTFALFGRWGDLPVAGIRPDYRPALLGLTRRLIDLGHRRIVFLGNRGQRGREPSQLERSLLEEIASHGIRTGAYNLPAWKDSREGFHRLLVSLFNHTPPTALVIEEIPHLVAALQFCGQRGIRVPQDLSIACSEERFDLAYCTPEVAHIRWDKRPIVRRIVRWADNVARGKSDQRRSFTEAEFVDGGTIGPVPPGKR